MTTETPPAPRNVGTDAAVGTHAMLFVAGFGVALVYLYVEYGRRTSPGFSGLTPAGLIWAALFCTQIGAWAVVTTMALTGTRQLLARETFERRVLARVAAATLLLAAACYAFFAVFIGLEVVDAAFVESGRDPGLSRLIAGLGFIPAAVSYLVLFAVASALLLTHAALQQTDIAALPLHDQISTLRQFGNHLRGHLFGAMVLVGLSSGSAVALNRARGNPLAPEYLVMHGALYSVLLGLLYVPAHLTLVRQAGVIADHVARDSSPREATSADDGRKHLEEELGLRLSGIPGWDIVASILVPLATSFLGK